MMKQDKIKHIVCGVIAAVAVGLPAYLQNVDLFAGLWSALAGALVAAIVKEYCDTGCCLDPTRWDWKDIGFTLIGGVLIALLILGLHFGRG